MYSPASAALARSGSLTISTSGTPQRFRSTSDVWPGVDVLAGVLFHVDAREADGARVELDAAADAERLVELQIW